MRILPVTSLFCPRCRLCSEAASAPKCAKASLSPFPRRIPHVNRLLLAASNVRPDEAADGREFSQSHNRRWPRWSLPLSAPCRLRRNSARSSAIRRRVRRAMCRRVQAPPPTCGRDDPHAAADEPAAVAPARRQRHREPNIAAAGSAAAPPITPQAPPPRAAAPRARQQPAPTQRAPGLPPGQRQPRGTPQQADDAAGRAATSQR